MKHTLPRDLVARLTWKGYGDLDLIVDEPLGATASYATPRTVFGGALVKNGLGKSPEEVYVCPRGFDGVYKFKLDKVADDPKEPIKEAKLEIIVHEGAANEQRIVKEIDPMKLEPIIIKLEGGRRKTVLPFVGQPTAEDLVKWTKPRPKVAAKPADSAPVVRTRTGSPGSRSPQSEPKRRGSESGRTDRPGTRRMANPPLLLLSNRLRSASNQ